MLIPAALELWLFGTRRRLSQLVRLETVVLTGLGLLYLGAVKVFAPDYLSSVVPKAMLTYQSYNNPLDLVVQKAEAQLDGILTDLRGNQTDVHHHKYPEIQIGLRRSAV